jgi:peptidyl-prolyl cis-trans isomerase A (cyclophilin A)
MHKFITFLLLSVLPCLISCNRTSNPSVIIDTDLGTITAEIYVSEAPITASNFLSLVERGVYNGAMFYRVVRLDNQPNDEVKIEVVQGGLFRYNLIRSHPPIAHETTEVTGVRHTDGTLSMARNKPGSASTEFFICVGDQPSLDFGGARNPDGQGFAAFGKVIMGMDVVRAIQALPDSGQILIDKIGIREMRLVRES